MCSKFKILFFCAFNILFVASNHHELYRAPTARTKGQESYVFNDREFIVQNMPVTWENAKILCRGQHNASLAVLDTKEKADFLAEALSESQFSIESIWVGARRSGADDPAGYRWPRGEELRRTAADVIADDVAKYGTHYPTWVNRTHVPVPEGGADCVALQRVAHDKPVFLDLPCYLERPFTCEKEAQLSVEVSELKTVRCRTGLYRVFDGSLDWHQAAAHCVLNKMTLANIGTLKCLKKLGRTMLKTRPSIESAWIGARGSLGKWWWVDSGADIFTLPPYSDAAPGAWPPMRYCRVSSPMAGLFAGFDYWDHSPIKESGCLQLDRHITYPPVFMEARCDRKMQFICYESVPLLRTKIALPSDDLYYYVLVREQLDWPQAYDNCLKMNGTLANLDNNDILIQLLLVMGENKDEPVEHVWISGRLNATHDLATDTLSLSWYNPITSKKIADPRTVIDAASGVSFIPPWLDDDFSVDSPCLNLDRQDHLKALVYGLPCDVPQSSICMIDKVIKPHVMVDNTTTGPEVIVANNIIMSSDSEHTDGSMKTKRFIYPKTKSFEVEKELKLTKFE